MKGVTLHDIHDVRVESLPEPELLEPTDAILRITLSAICGSDLHLYHGTIPGVMPGTIIGHEYVGVVVEVGSQVQRFRKGDRVTGSFHVACGNCAPCRRGAFNQCVNFGTLGYGVAFGDLQGTQAQFARIPYADTVLRHLSSRVSDEVALFTGDILTTAYGAVINAGMRPGDTVAVVGCGPVGIMAVQSALALGAGKVLAIDLDPSRTALAERVGAVPITSSVKNPVSAVNAATRGEGADVVIEAVGGAKTIALAFDLVRGGGKICAVGISSEEEFAFPLTTATVKDITFRVGLANIPRYFDETLALVEGGRIDPTVVISHRLPLEQAPEGYRLFAERKATKVLLLPNG